MHKKEEKARKLPQQEIKLGFDTRTVDLKVDQVIPSKPLPSDIRKTKKYLQILASVKTVGVAEPLVVTKDKEARGKYILLDGHMRLEALKELEEEEVTCIVSKDDEAFTYNKHINRLSTIQEHKMILRAVERGVSEAKIAQALNIDVKSIARKRNLLEGICPEAVELLKDKMVAGEVFTILRRMKPFQQIEAVMMMNDSNVYSVSYANAILASTPKEQLAEPNKPKRIKGLDEEQIARMERAHESLQREYKLASEDFTKDVFLLTFARGYIDSLLGNVKVVRYLAQNHPEFLEQFQKIVNMASLKGTAA